MDPDANLKEQRILAAKVQWQLENGEEPSRERLLRLTELMIALDDWICEGGFLPSHWK